MSSFYRLPATLSLAVQEARERAEKSGLSQYVVELHHTDTGFKRFCNTHEAESVMREVPAEKGWRCSHAAVVYPPGTMALFTREPSPVGLG
jgi:hypothetical protein